MHVQHVEMVPGAASSRGHMTGWAPFYDAIVGVLFLGPKRRLRERTADLAQLQPGECVLDVGCGTGTLTLTARRRVGSGTVAGIDAAA